jgi:hypothetical protein
MESEARAEPSGTSSYPHVKMSDARFSMTTFVLGAGASLHAGYPLAAGLGNRLTDWLAENPNEVNELYGSNLRSLRELYGDLNDLEQILTEIQECPPDSIASTMDDIGRRYAIRNMRLMIPEYFRSLRVRPSRLYEKFARTKVRPDDVVITFNYDVALERELKKAELWEIGDGYGFSLGIEAIPFSPVRVFKLHGSCNWLEIPFQGMTGFFQSSLPPLGSRPIILPAEFEFLGYPDGVSDPETPSGAAGAYPAIVLPTLNKRFYENTSYGRELESFWSSLWTHAETALRSSDRIVILGYSMPRADEKARELLLNKANRSAHIEIFCARDTGAICDAFSSNGFPDVTTLGNHLFEDYLE